MDLNEIARRHHAWVDQMGWHKITVLESMALIASEIGEAAAESIAGRRKALITELADILLRILDLCHTHGVDIQSEVDKAQVEWKTGTELGAFAELMVDFALWANTARGTALVPEFGHGAGKLAKRVLLFNSAFDLEAAIHAKMELNKTRGSRGRLK